MKRTRLAERILPAYGRGEELFHMITHIVGGGFGVLALVACVLRSALKGDAWGVVGGAIYGVSLIALYSMSSIYHGLRNGTAKKVLQVMDHCTIYFLIGGTYTPILFCAIRIESRVWAWVLFGIVWGLAAMACTFTAIDLKKYSTLSMICYVGMGWSVLLAARTAIRAIPLAGLLWLLGGGVAYTVGAVLYGIAKKKGTKYVHGIFHLFVLVGTLMQFVCVFFYVL